MSAPDSRMARPTWFSSICAPPYQTLKVITVTTRAGSAARPRRRRGGERAEGQSERGQDEQPKPSAGSLCD